MSAHPWAIAPVFFALRADCSAVSLSVANGNAILSDGQFGELPDPRPEWQYSPGYMAIMGANVAIRDRTTHYLTAAAVQIFQLDNSTSPGSTTVDRTLWDAFAKGLIVRAKHVGLPDWWIGLSQFLSHFKQPKLPQYLLAQQLGMQLSSYLQTYDLETYRSPPAAARDRIVFWDLRRGGLHTGRALDEAVRSEPERAAWMTTAPRPQLAGKRMGRTNRPK
jgi:hypothetical protein